MATEVIEPKIDHTTDIADKISHAFAKYWNVVLWNDDVHSYEFVIVSLMQIIGCSMEEAFKHADTVHHHGKSIVASETQEVAELYYEQLIALGLTATLERNS